MIPELAALLATGLTVKMSSATRARLETVWPVLVEIGNANGIPPAFLAGLAWTESDFVPTARNATTAAAGLFQIMPAHFKALGWTGADWSDPRKNALAGVRILKEHGLGKKSVSATLKGYGGFVTKDPTDYVQKVLARSVYVAADIGLRFRAGA